MASVWQTKDENELKCHRIAARLSTHLVANYFADEMGRILDEGKKVGCEKLARRVENRLEDEDAWKKAKGIKEVSVLLEAEVNGMGSLRALMNGVSLVSLSFPLLSF